MSEITLEEAKRNLLAMEMDIESMCSDNVSEEDEIAAKISVMCDTREAYYAMPNLQPFMRAWMIYLLSQKSEMDPDTPIDMSTIKRLEDVQRFTSMSGGALYHSAKAFCDSTELGVMTDQGGGVAGWHVGYHCTSLEAQRLYRAVKEKFEKAIKSGNIMLFCNPCSKRFV